MLKDKLPPLFLERIKTILKAEELPLFLETYDRDYRPSLRVNTGKIEAEEFFKLLNESCQEKVSWSKNSYFIERKSVFTKTPFYHAGLFYVQEASSMLPVEVLDPQPGETVLDMCASPGSKTTQIINKMQNRGLLIANEIKNDRVGRLIENVLRWGSKNTVVTNQNTRVFAEMPGFFDRILLDAPCSGEGMFRKDPEALSCWGINNIRKCSAVQKNILRDAAAALKTGGVLVYSTCTIAPEENEENVDYLLKTYPGCFEVEQIQFGQNGLSSFDGADFNPEVKKTFHFWPHKIESEAFFIAKIKKIKSINTETHFKKHEIRRKEPEFSKKAVRELAAQTKIGLEIEHIQPVGYKLYQWASIDSRLVLPYISLLKPVYLGVQIGTEKKDRIEPAHALALSFTRTECVNLNTVELDDDTVVQFLNGHEISYDGSAKEGFKIITYQGFPLGWANLKQQKLKNFFPHGMRGKL